MQIVVSADLGEFGPTQGKPVIYNFNKLYHAQAFIPWLIFFLAFIILKENRTKHAFLILIPIILLESIFSAFMNVLNIDNISRVQLDVMFKIIVVGFALVWLFSERIKNRNRYITVILATLVYFCFLLINLIGSGYGEDIINIVYLAVVSIPAIILAFFISAKKTTKPLKIIRFLIYLFVFLICILMVTFSLFTLSMIIFHPLPEASITITRWISEILTASLFAGFIYFLCLIPFWVLLLLNPFWRKRFDTVIG